MRYTGPSLWIGAGVLALLLITSVASAQTTSYTSWSWEGKTLEPARVDTHEVAALRDESLADEWLARDKALHVGASFLITLSSQYVFESKLELTEDEALPLAMTTALSAGVLKEVFDSQRSHAPHFCVHDLIADVVGVLLATGLILL